MSQNINLSVAGLYTSLNDFQGLPPGALDVAENVESRFKNVLEPRRGFEGLENSAVDGIHFIRLTNFYVLGIDRVVSIGSDDNLYYYTGVSPWPALPGDVVTNILPPDATYAKSRFTRAGQNLYVTAIDGIRSLCSGSSSTTVRAGVPKGLNLEASTNGDSSGFFSNNVAVTTTGTVSNTSVLITALADTAGIAVGQYVGGTSIPEGTTVVDIAESATISVQSGNTTAGSTTLSNIASNTGLDAGVLITGTYIPAGTTVVSVSGGGPYSVTMSNNAYQTATAQPITFSTAVQITMSAAATGNHSGETLNFYAGAQVGYRVVFGRVETDINGNTITRLGAASPVVICSNTSSTETNVTVTATIPKNSSDGRLTFVRLYRSNQTSSIDISPLDQYNLVYEATLSASDFANRVITITDDVPDSLVGIPLYSGSDQEGSLQANDPPPMSWDMCKFRDFMLYGNITRPTTLSVTIVAVGSPSGIQSGDHISISGNFAGVSFSETYAASGAENQASRIFKVYTGGTPSQNITDTTNSLIRVINYDNALPIHALLLSGTTDLPGQILFEADNPGYDTFHVNASAHTSAYDPVLSHVDSAINTINNGLGVSKTQELEAVPATNLLYVGDSSSNLLRIIPLRDYTIALKSDGIYKIIGTSPGGLTVLPFDLTTKIIGPDTAVALNSGVWALSTQGVVSISDAGVDAKSVPIDDQLNVLIGSFLNALVNTAFAIGYESDRKYILSVPDNDNTITQTQYIFNYVTSAWSTWTRNLYTGFIHSNENKLYIARADDDNLGVSKERKTFTYTDYVDESVDNTIVSVSGTEITLSDTDGVEAGDILYQDANNFSPILSVDLSTNVVTVLYDLAFVPGAVEILNAYLCTVTWKQVFADNPAFVRQYGEGLALFKNTRFNTATMKFVTDYSQNDDEVTLSGTGNGFWGLFGWGEIPWGGQAFPSNIRFLVPQDKQMGSYLLPTLEIKQGYSDFKFQGLAIQYSNVSAEVGL